MDKSARPKTDADSALMAAAAEFLSSAPAQSMLEISGGGFPFCLRFGGLYARAEKLRCAGNAPAALAAQIGAKRLRCDGIFIHSVPPQARRELAEQALPLLLRALAHGGKMLLEAQALPRGAGQKLPALLAAAERAGEKRSFAPSRGGGKRQIYYFIRNPQILLA